MTKIIQSLPYTTARTLTKLGQQKLSKEILPT